MLLNVDGDHVLEDTRPQSGALVRHRTVLHRSSEHNHVTSRTFHLQRVGVEILSVVRILRDLVRPGSDGGGSILLAETLVLTNLLSPSAQISLT